MKILDKKIVENTFSYVVSLDKDDLVKIKTKTLQDLSKNIKIPGFRPSKAPLELVEKYVDSQRLNDKFINIAINEYYPKSLDGNKYIIISEPKLEISKFVYAQTLEFKITLEVLASIKLKDYKSIKINLKEEPVTKNELDIALKDLKKRITIYKIVKREAKKADQVNIDYKGTDPISNKSLDNTTGSNYDLVLGSNSFIPGFEDNLIGLKKLDIKKFELIFPADYPNADFKNKKVLFEVKINAVKEPIETEFTNENIKTFGAFNTVTEFKNELKNQIKKEKDLDYSRKYDSLLLEELANLVQNTIPKSMLDKETDLVKEDEKKYALFQGQTWEEYLTRQNLTQEEYDKKAQEFALKRIKSGLAVSKLFELLKIEINPEEIENRIDELKKRYSNDSKMVTQLDTETTRREIELQIITEKVISKVKKDIKT